MAKVMLKLKEIMQERGVTQLELAQAIDVPQGTISRWSGNRVDSYNNRIIQRICEYFDIEPGDLIVIKDTKTIE